MISSAFLRLVTVTVLATAANALFAASDKAASKYTFDLLTNYIPISKALAADDLKAAQAAATALSKQAESTGMTSIAAKAKALAESPDIAKARAAFRPLTGEIEPLAANEKAATVMYCPMAPGTWIQDNGPVENPYYGKMMFRCGGPKAAK